MQLYQDFFSYIGCLPRCNLFVFVSFSSFCGQRSKSNNNTSNSDTSVWCKSVLMDGILQRRDYPYQGVAKVTLPFSGWRRFPLWNLSFLSSKVPIWGIFHWPLSFLGVFTKASRQGKKKNKSSAKINVESSFLNWWHFQIKRVTKNDTEDHLLVKIF